MPAGRRTSDPVQRPPCCCRTLACRVCPAHRTHVDRQIGARTRTSREEGVLDETTVDADPLSGGNKTESGILDQWVAGAGVADGRNRRVPTELAGGSVRGPGLPARQEAGTGCRCRFSSGTIGLQPLKGLRERIVGIDPVLFRRA